jgi:hypothetical protein
MTMWTSVFDEPAGTVVQDCGSPADFWVNASASAYWWMTDGNGRLRPSAAPLNYNVVHHAASSPDQSLTLRLARASSSAKKPQVGLRHTVTSHASSLQVSGSYTLLYTSGGWRLYYGWSRVATVADQDYADGVDDPDGDETRQIEVSFVGTTITLTVTKGNGASVGSATVEDAAVTDANNVVLLLNGSYSSTDDLSSYCLVDALTAVDGVGSAAPSNLKVYQSGQWVQGTLQVYQSGQWVQGELKRYNGPIWG